MKFRNPIIPGFHPDPSVCRLKDDYYLVTSSFEYFPGVPLYYSKDLIHWQQRGYCLTRRSQLFLEGAGSSGGIFAPTIRCHNGIFYMATTNVTGGGNFYVYTDNLLAEWSEPVWVDQGGIDPSLLFDDDGKIYFTSTGKNCIVQSEIDIRSGKRLMDIKEIWTGTGGSYPEGPHLYKFNKLYYLMIAEGGTSYGHMETIAKSDNPWGPFKSCPHNPILTHRSSSNPIQATGHGDLIEAHNGSWWLVFLGIRPNPPLSYHHLGRETFLAPVSWTNDGWPIVGHDGKVHLEIDVDCLPLHRWDKENARDDFENQRLELQWNFLRNPKEENWSLIERPGWLKLIGSEVTLNDTNSPAFIGRRQEHFCCSVSTLLDFSPKRDQEEAGLTVFMNEHHHYEIAATRLKGKRHVIVRRRIGSLAAIVACEKIKKNGFIKLKIEAGRNIYRFSYALNNSEFKIIAEGETRYLSTEVASGFTGVYFAMYATGNGKKSTAPAFFDYFEYTPSEKEIAQ
jgi:alpha-N-arabinofuranosidase